MNKKKINMSKIKNLENISSRAKIEKVLFNIEQKLVDLSEGYLSDFDNDPEASAKGEIDGLLDKVRIVLYNLNDIY